MAELVNAAYGLTAEEVALLWTTAPPRMPGRGRAYDREQATTGSGGGGCSVWR